MQPRTSVGSTADSTACSIAAYNTAVVAGTPPWWPLAAAALWSGRLAFGGGPGGTQAVTAGRVGYSRWRRRAPWESVEGRAH